MQIAQERNCLLTFTRLWRWTSHSMREIIFQNTSVNLLTLILLTWRIWWAPNNASRWQMGFNSAFKGL